MKGKLNEDIDKKIIECLDNKAEEISVSENMFFKIRADILKENEGGFLKMKIGFFKVKTMLLVGILCIATTITCVAATNGMHWTVHSTGNDIKQFPTAYTVKKTVGYLPKYVENFKGGFKFDSMYLSNSSLIGDDSKPVIKTKDVHFNYIRDGAKKNQSLFMNATAIDEEYFNKDINRENAVTEYNGVKLYYNTIQRKVVPADYKQTEEELKLINEGALDMAFGSNEIEEYKSQSVGWYENGISYSIINEDYDDVGKDAMLEMAKTVIDK